MPLPCCPAPLPAPPAAGAFGSVYYGTYAGEEVAVKLMNVPRTVSRADADNLRRDFRQEVAVWSKLNHPNVVQFVGASLDGNSARTPPQNQLAGADSPQWAILSEYMSGGTLKAYLTRKRKLPLPQVLKLALDIARGLEYLHSHDIVHRDLKSENVLLDHKYTAKIADFGVARTEAHNPVDMTAETGTVRWMAPEPYDRSVDVYSFGIVLWELYTCEHPFKNFSFVQLAFAVVNKGERPKIPEACPPELASIMQTCWDGAASKRPDFSEVVKRLEGFEAKVLENKELNPPAKSGCQCAIL
eukprot:jgi/Mesen1/7161/ME000037S06520